MLIAERLGKSLGETKSSVTVNEFWMWLQLFKEELQEKPEYVLLAQIAYQIYAFRVSLLGTGGRPVVEFKDFLLKAEESAKQVQEELEEEEKKALIDAEARRRRAIHFAAFGVKFDEDGKPVGFKTRTPPQRGPNGIRRASGSPADR